MWEVFKRPRATLLLAFLVSLTLMTLNFRGGSTFSFVSLKADVRDVVNPLRGGINSVFRPIADVVTGAFRYSTVRTQNLHLQNEINALKGESLKFGSAEAQLKRLTALEAIPFEGSIPGVSAPVIDFTPTNLQLTFESNKGYASGVKLGDPVVTGEGLAGKVVAVSSDTSTILMVTDPRFSVGVRLDPAGDVGLAAGTGQNDPMGVSYVTPGTTFVLDQILTTSGLQGEVFPPGIPVGKVIAAGNAAGSLQENVSIDPIVDYATLQYVRILLWSPPK